jgi:serine/threonine protein kinase
MLTAPRVRWTDVQYDPTGPSERLGEGAFANVYKATGTEYVEVPGRTTREARELLLAVKIWKNQNPDQNEKETFMREIEVRCRAQHPSLLSVVSFSLFPYAIAMERCHKSLGEVLYEQGRGQAYRYDKHTGETVEWDDTKRAMAAFGIAVGMCYLHEHNIIHRNLKSDKVMLDERLRVRIGDFVLGRVLSCGSRIVNTAPGITMDIGTPPYMAPELFSYLNEGGGYTTAVDVYAYAMILYELVLLERPWAELEGMCWEGWSTRKLMGYLSKGVRPTIPGFVLPAYRELIEACWAQAPGDRPTFRQIVEQIQGDKLAFENTDLDEFEDYQMEMLKALNEPRRGTGK